MRTPTYVTLFIFYIFFVSFFGRDLPVPRKKELPAGRPARQLFFRGTMISFGYFHFSNVNWPAVISAQLYCVIYSPLKEFSAFTSPFSMR